MCDESKTGVSGTVSPTNNQYYKVLLKSGTTYTFRYNKDGTWDGDMRISLKDSDGNWVRQDWDSDPSEQFDRQQLKISKDFHEIKYIIEKYNIKNTSEDDLKKRGIDSISDKELLQYIYKNLMDDENYKGAEYIVNILSDNSLKLQFEKDRMQQGEFKFGTTAYKLDFLSRAILRI